MGRPLRTRALQRGTRGVAIRASRDTQSGLFQLRGDLQKEIRRLEQHLQRCILQAHREKEIREHKGRMSAR